MSFIFEIFAYCILDALSKVSWHCGIWENKNPTLVSSKTFLCASSLFCNIRHFYSCSSFFIPPSIFRYTRNLLCNNRQNNMLARVSQLYWVLPELMMDVRVINCRTGDTDTHSLAQSFRSGVFIDFVFGREIESFVNTGVSCSISRSDRQPGRALIKMDFFI